MSKHWVDIDLTRKEIMLKMFYEIKCFLSSLGYKLIDVTILGKSMINCKKNLMIFI